MRRRCPRCLEDLPVPRDPRVEAAKPHGKASTLCPQCQEEIREEREELGIVGQRAVHMGDSAEDPE